VAGKQGAVELVRQTVKDAGEVDVPGLAAEMAHHSLFALFSFLLLLAGLVAISDDVFGIQDMRERIVSSAQDVLPQNASAIVEGFLNDVVDSKGQGALVFGLFGVAWAGSNLVGSAMKGLNRISRTEERRGFVQRKLLAVALALVLGGMLVAASVVIVFRGAFVDWLDDVIGRGEAELVMTVVVWPLALLVVALAAAVLYWKGPDRDEPFRWVTPGAMLFAAAWVAASIAASIYLSEAEPANRTYGLIAAILAAIVWLYWSNLLFLAGAVLNARVEDARTSRSSEQRTEQSARAQP
jgi:membrane protein